jgi:hypothetical protein
MRSDSAVSSGASFRVTPWVRPWVTLNKQLGRNSRLDGALDYQLKLIPLVAPPPPFDPLAEPKRTGSSFFPASSVLHPASSNDPARAKKTKEVALLVVKNFPILNAGDTAFRIRWQITLFSHRICP